MNLFCCPNCFHVDRKKEILLRYVRMSILKMILLDAILISMIVLKEDYIQANKEKNGTLFSTYATKSYTS
jgi:hypothetical protein